MIHAILIAATVATSDAQATRPTSAEAHATGEATISIPEKFFRGNVLPDGKVQLVYTKPNQLDPVQASNVGWWNAVAKFKLLVETNADFRAAYQATTNDPDLQTTGITFKAWSGGSQKEKLAVRDQMHAAVQRVVGKHHLRELLEQTQVDETKITEVSATLRGTPSPQQPLVKFCPGALNNVSVNPEHPSFAQFQRALEDPHVSRQYQEALKEFSLYLEGHPTSSLDEKNAELGRLVSPVLGTIR